MAVELYHHQVDALLKLSNGKILCGGTGSGKSVVSIAYYWYRVSGGSLRPFKAPKSFVPLYIITTARKRDSLEWEGDLAKFGLSKHIQSITIDSWNNIKNYVGASGAFFIFDEQRLVGNGTWVKSFLKIAKLNRWILLSATPGDNWMDYVPVFIANGFYKNRSEFVHEHVVYSPFVRYQKVDRYIGESRLKRLRAKVLVDMPYSRKTVRHRHSIPVLYDEGLYDTIKKTRFDPWKEEPLQNAGSLWYLLRKVTNSHDSRLEEVLKLTRRHKRLIIFYNFDYEVEILRRLGERLDGWVIHEWNGHKHEQVPEGERWLYLVNYMAGAEAWNCTETDAMVFWSLNYSYRVMEQSEGRIDRLNTPYKDLYYYRLISSSPVDRVINKALLNKKSFNESAYLEKEF